MKKQKGGCRRRPAMFEGLESRIHLSGTPPIAAGGGPDTSPPVASRVQASTFQDPFTVAWNSFVFSVRYHDAHRVDTDSLDDGDVRVTGPRGFTAFAHLVWQGRGKHGSTRTAAYAVYGPNGRWSSDDNGIYALHLEAGEVSDLSGNSTAAGDLGTMEVAIERRHGTRTLRQTVGPSFPGRSQVTGVGVGTTALFAGGYGLTDNAYSDVVDVYAGATGTWSSGPRLGTARAGVAAVAVGNLAIFAGGYTNAVPSDAVDVYDAATATWSVTTLPRAARDLGVATVGDRAFFIDPLGGSNGSAAAYVYDAGTREWSTVALPRGCARAVTVGSKVVFPGSSYSPSPGEYRVSDEIAIYDDDGGTWTTVRRPGPPNHVGAVRAVAAVGDQVVILDGRLEFYDLVTGRWSVTPAYISADSMVTVGSKLVLTDGLFVEIYDVAKAEWSRRYLLLQRGQVSTAVLGSKAMFAGGLFGDADGSTSATDLVDVYDAETGQWSITRMSHRRSEPVMVRAADQLIVMGSPFNDAGTDSADVLTNGSFGPALTGRVSPNAGGASASVTLRNSGNAALAGPFPVVVYASRAGRRSVVLGQVEVAQSLAAGASAQVSVPLLVPEGLDMGRYRLVAAAGRGRRATAFATWTDVSAPRGTLVDAPDVTQPMKSYSFSFRYESPFGIDRWSLGYGNVVVTGPDGFAAFAFGESMTADDGGDAVVIQYTLRDIDGWRGDATGNGTYTVHLQAEEVRDRAGYAAMSDRLGRFRVAVPG